MSGKSIAVCEALAWRLATPLIVVRRQRGDRLARWQQRWRDNLVRYRDLECVKLILPWSTPGMRFCTSERKTSIICRELTRRFSPQPVINVVGIRRQESAYRALKPVAKPNPALGPKLNPGLDWNPIIDWQETDVWRAHREGHLPVHEAYRVYGSSRVSCVFGIMSSASDLLPASDCAASVPLYREMVSLEATSTFSFQADRWLADVRPDLLPDALKKGITQAKQIGRLRACLESNVMAHLLCEKGYPVQQPRPERRPAKNRSSLRPWLTPSGLPLTTPPNPP